MSISILKLINNDIEEEKIALYTLNAVIALVNRQQENKYILGVFNDSDELINLKTEDMCDWVLNIRIIGNAKQKAEVYITVQTIKGSRELVRNQVELLKVGKIKLNIKYTTPEHTVRIGILVRTNLEYTNLQFYEQYYKDKASYTDQIFELKKDIIYK